MMTHLTDVINMWVLELYFLEVKDGNTKLQKKCIYLYVYCLKFTALSYTNVDLRPHSLLSVRPEYYFVVF